MLRVSVSGASILAKVFAGCKDAAPLAGEWAITPARRESSCSLRSIALRGEARYASPGPAGHLISAHLGANNNKRGLA